MEALADGKAADEIATKHDALSRHSLRLSGGFPHRQVSLEVDTATGCYGFCNRSTGEQRSFGFPAAIPKFTRWPTWGLSPAPKKSVR